jgi:hypothetical protein
MSLTAGQLFVSSYNNQDYDTSTDFRITLAVPVTKAKGIRVLSATIPNLMMPFGVNDNKWRFSVAGTSYTVLFPTNLRWATIADFLNYVNGTMFPAATLDNGNPQALPATLFYNTSQNQLYLTANGIISMPGWAWNNPTGSSISYNANFRLGWTSISPVTSTGAGPYTLYADGFPNVFLRTNNIYITTNLATDSNNDANVGNIIQKVPVTIGWGGLVVFENTHADVELSPIFAANFKDISIRLLDEDYQPLVNPGNAYFNVVFGIVY